MRDTSNMSKYNKQVKEKHYLSDLTSLFFLYLASCFLFTTEKTNIEQNFQTQRRNKTVFLNAFIEIKWMFWSFHEGQLKALEQFEAKVYSSFQQVAHELCKWNLKNCSFQIHLRIILCYWHYDIAFKSTLGIHMHS